MQYDFLITLPEGGNFFFSNVNKLEIEKKFTNTSGEAFTTSYSSVFRNCYDIITLDFIEPLNADPESDKLTKLMPILEKFSKTQKPDQLFMLLTCSIEKDPVFRYFVMLSNYSIERSTENQLYECSFTFVGSKRPPRINSSLVITSGTPLPVTTGKFQI